MSFQFKRVSIILLLTVLCACNSYPTDNVSLGEERPAIVVEGASKTAALYVDGLLMGNTSRFSGNKNKLLIEEGRHKVVVKDNGVTVYSENIFVSGGQVKIISITN